MKKASAPAKIILFGEHFVVYGNPAILAAISMKITVSARAIKTGGIAIRSDIATGEYSNSGFNGSREAKAILDPLHSAIREVLLARKKVTGIEINISSKVPHGIGLGSSAASCVATVAAVDSLFHKPKKQWVCDRAIESERIIHKNSSGADCYISTFGGLIHYTKSEGFQKLRSKGSLPLVIASTGVRHSTGDLVAGVKKFKDQNESLFESLAFQADKICRQAMVAIANGDREKLGILMNENQALLEQIGVSHEKAGDLIAVCRKAGALGSKITGAGGGGAVIALASSKKVAGKIASRVKAAGYDAFEAEIDRKGLIA